MGPWVYNKGILRQMVKYWATVFKKKSTKEGKIASFNTPPIMVEKIQEDNTLNQFQDLVKNIWSKEYGEEWSVISNLKFGSRLQVQSRNRIRYIFNIIGNQPEEEIVNKRRNRMDTNHEGFLRLEDQEGRPPY